MRQQRKRLLVTWHLLLPCPLPPPTLPTEIASSAAGKLPGISPNKRPLSGLSEELALELRHGKSTSWTHIMNNLDTQFPFGNVSPEYHLILKEIGAYNDADILSMASDRTSYMKTLTFHLGPNALVNQA
eukprot:16437838-Heterocapsa_arctica.AAC.1